MQYKRWHRNQHERNSLIGALYKQGATMEEIASRFELTRQRIQQVISRTLNLSRKDGGGALKAERRQQERQRLKDEKCRLKWGMTCSEKNTFAKLHGTKPFLAFKDQKQNSKRRNIAFLLSFQEWWDLWQSSGHWGERGKKGGKHLYVMSRHGDVGPYSRDNIKITTQSENMREHGRICRLTP